MSLRTPLNPSRPSPPTPNSCTLRGSPCCLFLRDPPCSPATSAASRAPAAGSQLALQRTLYLHSHLLTVGHLLGCLCSPLQALKSDGPGVPPSPQPEWQPRWPEGKSLQTGSGPLIGGQSPRAMPATRHREVRQPPGKGPRAIPSYGKVRIPWNKGELLPGARRPHWSDLQTDPTRQTVKDSRH